MEQLIIKTAHDVDVPSAIIIGTEFYVTVEPDGEGLEVTIEKEEGHGHSYTIPVDKDDYAWVQELVYESWKTGFEKKFSETILADICEYMQKDRYWDDDEFQYRPYFDMAAYEELWEDRLYRHIDDYKSGKYPLTPEAERVMLGFD